MQHRNMPFEPFSFLFLYYFICIFTLHSIYSLYTLHLHIIFKPLHSYLGSTNIYIYNLSQLDPMEVASTLLWLKIFREFLFFFILTFQLDGVSYCSSTGRITMSTLSNYLIACVFRLVYCHIHQGPLEIPIPHEARRVNSMQIVMINRTINPSGGMVQYSNANPTGVKHVPVHQLQAVLQ